MPPSTTIVGDMQAQLERLYAERQRLHRALGTADADQLIAMVRSLEAQLVSLYQTDRTWANPKPLES